MTKIIHVTIWAFEQKRLSCRFALKSWLMGRTCSRVMADHVPTSDLFRMATNPERGQQ